MDTKKHDMIQKWLSFFIPGYGIDRQEREEIVKYLTFAGWKSTVAVGCMIILFELYFLANSFVNQASLAGYHNWYRASYIFLIVCSLIGIVAVLIGRRNKDRHWRGLQAIEAGYFVCILIWGVGITAIDTAWSHSVSPILFMTLIMCGPLCMYMEPLFYLAVDVVSNAAMIFLISTTLDTGEQAAADLMNFIVYFIIQTIVGCTFLQIRFSFCLNMRERLRESERARQATEAKAAYLSNMSHEIRTPLNSILGMNELIERDSHNEQVLGYAENIAQSGQTLLGLVNDMLDFSKIESGKMTLLENSYSLSELIKSVYGMIFILAQKKGLSLETEVAEDVYDSLRGDQNRLRQVMVNLLSNAVKYTRQGTVTLRVKTKKMAAERVLLRVEIEDTGMGIKKEDQPYLFDAFTRVDEDANRHIEGTGLGLMICDRFIHMMQGTLAVESEYGHGSMFFFEVEQGLEGDLRVGTLSLQQNEADHKEREEELADRCAGACVLVVDDTPMNLVLFQNMIRHTGLTVETAESGAECLEKIKKIKYDLIFMDHMMPQMDGLETFARMGELTHLNKDTPVVMLTANVGAEDEKNYRSAGFATYLSKPMQRAELEKILLEYLPKRETPLLDVKIGLAYAGDDEKGYRAVLESYVETGKTWLEEIAHLFENEKWQEYVIKVHGLKSSSRTIGAQTLSELSEELERAGKCENYDLIRQKNDSLLKLYEGVLEQCREELAPDAPVAQKTDDNAAVRELTQEEWGNELMKLKEAAEQYDGDELLRLCEALTDGSCNGVLLREELREVQAAVYNFEFEQAQDIIARLISPES